MHNVTAGANHDSIDFRLFPYSSTTGGGTAPFAQVTVAPNSTQTRTYTLPAGTVGFSAECGRHTNGSNNSNQAFMEVTAYCGGQPGQLVAPCCPPDPRLTQLIMSLIGQVQLIQRQAVPFAYVYGTNHTGLSGNGELTVTGLIGASVDVTTLPSSYGQVDGTPVELFDLGFITFGTTDGWQKSIRIDHDGSLMLPPAAGAFTRLGYTLSPGVVVAIRELVREP
jgi:hypothetical protein